MSDLFRTDVLVDFIQKVFDVMRRAHWHTFQVLTKRSNRLLELGPKIDWSSNVWMGVVRRDGYLSLPDALSIAFETCQSSKMVAVAGRLTYDRMYSQFAQWRRDRREVGHRLTTSFMGGTSIHQPRWAS